MTTIRRPEKPGDITWEQSAEFLDQLQKWTTHRLSAELLAAMKDLDWFIQEIDQRIGSVQFAHQSNYTEIPTPNYVTKGQWPGETYSHVWHVVLHVKDHRITSIFLSTHAAPWVNGRTEGPTSFKRARDWIKLAGALAGGTRCSSGW